MGKHRFRMHRPKMKPYGEPHNRDLRHFAREVSTQGWGYARRMTLTAWHNLRRIGSKLARHHAKEDLRRQLDERE